MATDNSRNMYESFLFVICAICWLQTFFMFTNCTEHVQLVNTLSIINIKRKLRPWLTGNVLTGNIFNTKKLLTQIRVQSTVNQYETNSHSLVIYCRERVPNCIRSSSTVEKAYQIEFPRRLP